jgi:hypothetical protein
MGLMLGVEFIRTARREQADPELLTGLKWQVSSAA